MNSREFQARYGNGRIEDEMPKGIVGKAPKPQIRIPKSRQPNKTEAAWIEQCLRRHIGCNTLYEPFALNLPSGTKYTPDVVVMEGERIVAIYEVKGPHIHNQRSIHAFKEARSAFSSWDFKFAQLTKSGWAVA